MHIVDMQKDVNKMATNRGKQFENVIKEAFEKVPETSVVRLHDQTTGYIGSSNHCDFIVYHKPYEYHIECKSVHGNTFPLSNITDTQYKGMLEKSQIDGVIAGVICWWIDKDVTLFIPIQTIQQMKGVEIKSIRYDVWDDCEGDTDMILISGIKKRVFWEYDMQQFFEEVEK